MSKHKKSRKERKAARAQRKAARVYEDPRTDPNWREDYVVECRGDIYSYTDNEVITVGPAKYKAHDIEEVQALVVQWVVMHDILPGEWTGGKVWVEDKLVAHVDARGTVKDCAGYEVVDAYDCIARGVRGMDIRTTKKFSDRRI